MDLAGAAGGRLGNEATWDRDLQEGTEQARRFLGESAAQWEARAQRPGRRSVLDALISTCCLFTVPLLSHLHSDKLGVLVFCFLLFFEF